MAGDQLHDHGRQLGLPNSSGFYIGRRQELRENIQAIAFHRVGDEDLIRQLERFDVAVLRQGMLVGDSQHQLIAKQGLVVDGGIVLWVRGNHHIQIPSQQGGQGRKRKRRTQVQRDIRPLLPEGVQRGHQPLKAGMAINRHMQTTRTSGGKPLQVAFGSTDTRQDVIGQNQNAQGSRGQASRAGAPVQQLHLQPHFQIA